MSQLDRKYSNSPRSPSTPTVVEQLLRRGEMRSPSASPRCHDMEGDHGYHHKKSVLSKVKDKAKKWKHSFSMKKRHNNTEEDGSSTTPSWGVSLDELEDENEDPEYFGAPMYESELAPEACKESARQHPRADHVISSNHFLPNNVHQYHHRHNHYHGIDEERGTPTSSANLVNEKIAPINTTRSDHSSNEIAKKIQGLTVSTHLIASDTPIENDTYQPMDNNFAEKETDELPALESGGLDSPGKLVSPGKQVWDKGVSVKEFIMNTFEPGEDERALSRVIVDAMSPRKQPGDASMVDKVKEAVSSMLWTSDESANSNRSTATKSSTPTSVPGNANQVVEEENQGKILQAN
ncbi:hypothetical protein ACFE04_013159 [Oxalis oulophora]